MLKKQILSVVMLVKAKTIWEFLDSHSQEGQLILKSQILWTACLPQFTEMSHEVMHYSRRTCCQEVIDIDATQGNYITRQNLGGKAKSVSRWLLEQRRFLSDEAKRLVDLRKEDAILLPLRGKGGLSDRLSPFLRPELRSFPKTIDGLVHKPDMTWREKLELIKDSRRTKYHYPTLGQRSIQESSCNIKRSSGKVRRRSTPR